MKISKKRRQFKDRLGQANHFLITTLVGLDAIETKKITQKPFSFNTSWNPKNQANSAIRSRAFILKSVLGWTVESLEMYMTLANRKPKLYEENNIDITAAYSRAGQSIFHKVTMIGDLLNIDPVLIAMMECLITWRNYIFHYDIDNEIREQSFNVLNNEKNRIKKDFCGLDIDNMQNKWENNRDFTFKEAASLIHATHLFVELVDRNLLNVLDDDRYILESLMMAFKNCNKTKAKYLSLKEEKLQKFIATLVQNNIGLIIDNEKAEEYINLLDRKKIIEL